MKYAKFSDDFLSDFRLDDNGETLVLTDNRGYTRAVKLLTYDEKPQGEWKLDDTEQFCYCSNCEDTYYPRPLDPSWYYCPHCGADMREEEE